MRKPPLNAPHLESQIRAERTKLKTPAKSRAVLAAEAKNKKTEILLSGFFSGSRIFYFGKLLFKIPRKLLLLPFHSSPLSLIRLPYLPRQDFEGPLCLSVKNLLFLSLPA